MNRTYILTDKLIDGYWFGQYPTVEAARQAAESDRHRPDERRGTRRPRRLSEGLDDAQRGWHLEDIDRRRQCPGRQRVSRPERGRGSRLSRPGGPAASRPARYEDRSRR